MNKQLIKYHSDVEKENIIMFTGSDRKDKTTIQMISVKRTETNSSVSHDVTKLSGSKIRALCLLNINSNKDIYDMYGGSLSPEEVDMLIITPVRDKILEKGMSALSSAPGGGAASAYGGSGSGAAFGSKNKNKKRKKNTYKKKKNPKQNASQRKKRGSKQKKNTLFDEIDD